jgi:AraC-like DNA-binding protein
VALRAVEAWQLPYRGKPGEAPISALLSKNSRACSALLQVQQKLSVDTASGKPATVIDDFGMCETAVPVRVGTQVIGLLQTGQVFPKQPTKKQFDRAVSLAQEWGVNADRKVLESAFFQTRVVAKKQRDSAVRLLSIFAQHLAMASNELVIEQHQPEPLLIAKAKEYIQQHLQEHLPLRVVAMAVNCSQFSLCKQFKKATGINFVEYLSRARVEAAKNLLLNPNLRVSEIAYEVGFRSLTHFNRIFRRIVGLSPSDYRRHVSSLT